MIMENSTANSTNSSFENGIRWWSLEFADDSIEKQYQSERISLKRVPRQIKIFFIIAAAINGTLILLDSLSAFVLSPSYQYHLYDILLLPMYVPIFMLEFVFYKWRRLSCLRGSLFTCFIYFIIFYASSSRFSESVDYPIVSPTVLLWHGSMFFIHIFYVRSWIISFVTYSIVYVEIISILFTIYGGRFFEHTIAGGVIDTLYYAALFATFIGFSVYAFRTFELKERASFFCEHQAKCEMEEWKSLLNDLPEPVILAQGGEITFHNSATQKFFTLAPNANESHVLQELDRVRAVIPTNKTLSQLIKEPIPIPGGEPNSMDVKEFVYTKGTRKNYKLQLKHVAIRPTVGFPITEYILHDITTVEELEREKAQRHCFRLLVATASHDIRTPINAVQGVLDILSEKLLGTEEQKELRVAKIAVKKMELYVRGLAFLQHIEVGTLEMEKETFGVKEVVDQVVDYFAPAVEMKGIKISIKADTTLPLITLDKEKYEIILYHILENAVKYTLEGSILVSLSYSSDQKTLHTSVTDTGIGMDKEQQTKLFKLFAKKSDFDPSCPQGIGLGLFLVGSLVSLLGGSLQVESSSGAGTTVSFSVKILEEIASDEEILDEQYNPKPLPSISANCWRSLGSVLQSRENTKPTSDAILSSRELLGNSRKFSLQVSCCSCPKVLIVDDEPFNVFILQKFLTSAGIQSDTALNGKVAVEAMLKRKDSCQVCKGYKIVYMDINMPIMNGIAAMEKINELVKERIIPNVTVIAVTAAAQTEEQGVITTYQNYGFKELCKGYIKLTVK